jgi:NhaP-type Na+/H+ or K+/H+ antiporter
MRPRREALVVGLAIGALTGIGAPFVELWRDCRSPESEACVWGRALLPVTLGVGVIVGLVVGVAAYAVMRWWQRSTGRDDGA